MVITALFVNSVPNVAKLHYLPTTRRTLLVLVGTASTLALVGRALVRMALVGTASFLALVVTALLAILRPEALVIVKTLRSAIRRGCKSNQTNHTDEKSPHLLASLMTLLSLSNRALHATANVPAA